MANAITLELEIDAKSGKASIKRIEKDIKKLGTSMTKSMKKTTKSMQKSIDSIDFKKMGIAAAAAVVSVGVGLKSVLDAFVPFETALANVSTLGDYSAETMKMFKDSLIDLPPILGSTTELTKGLYQALSAGVDPSESIDFITLSAKAAKAGLTDVFTAVDAGTTIMNAFGMETKDTEYIFDIMFNTVKEGKTTFEELASTIGKISPIASAAGISVEEMHAAIATLTKGGFATSEASARLATAIGTIVKPSAEAEKQAEKLGLAFNAQALKAEGLHDFLLKVKEATGGNIETMADLFGGMESLSVMLSLTGAQSGEFTKILKSMENAAGSSAVAFEKQKNTLSSLWGAIKATAEKIGILIGMELAPWLKDVAEQTLKWATENKNVIKTKIKEYAEDIKGVVELLSPVLGFVAEHLKTIVYILGTLVAIKAVSWVVAIAVSLKSLVVVLTAWIVKAKLAAVAVGVFTTSLISIGVVLAAALVAFKVLKWVSKIKVVEKAIQLSINNIYYFFETFGLKAKLIWFKLAKSIKGIWVGFNNWFVTAMPKTASLLGLDHVVVEQSKSISDIEEQLVTIAKKYKTVAEVIQDEYKDVEVFKDLSKNTDESFTGLSKTINEGGKKTTDVVKEMVLNTNNATKDLLGGETKNAIETSMNNIRELFAKDLTINVIDNTSSTLIQIQNLLSQIKDKTITVTTKYQSTGSSSGGDSSTGSSSSSDTLSGGSTEDISFQKGTGLEGLPYTGMFYGHKGEIVKNPAESDEERAGVTGNTYNITVSPTFLSGDRTAAREVAVEIQRELDDLSVRRS